VSDARGKPLLRGVSHQVAAGVALIAGIFLVRSAATARGALAAAIYAGSLTALFTISATYHRPNWSPKARARMRRLDHSAIFLLIAGTYTPFCFLLDSPSGRTLLTVVWCGAALGMLRAIFWVNAPKVFIAVTYLALGWVVIPWWPSLKSIFTVRELVLLAIGGAAYSTGAIVYALKKPDPFPTVFGYHEIFHALVIVAAGCHFAAVMEAIAKL
jgi:hemolysin III